MDKYGIIGNPLGHSFSKKYFEQKFKESRIDDAVFENYELPEIQDVASIIQDPAVKGFCITIPYKKAIMAYLSTATPAVKAMQACNCVQIKAGKCYGYNTDVIGFEKSFTPQLATYHEGALILGTGGAARAVAYVLDRLNIPYKFVSRNPAPGQLTYEAVQDPELIKSYPVWINCSPLGTFPKVDTAPAMPYHLLSSVNYLYDLVYNPPLTQFLKHGQEKGAKIQNGLPMLEIQAEENWRIWNQ